MTKRSSTSKKKTINDTLLNWSKTSDLLKTFFKGFHSYDTLISAILSDDNSQRELSSIDFIENVWGQYPVLGPTPPVKLLQKFEYDRKFYENYRSHVSHVTGVFLLGLYIYENNTIINQSIKEYLDISDEESSDGMFLKIWVATALFHDMGYLIENDEANTGSELEQEICKCLNEILAHPLSSTYYFKDEIDSSKEKRIIQDNEIFTKEIITISDIIDSKSFDWLKQYGNDSKLNFDKCNNCTNAIEEYYNYAQKTAPSNRKPFKDHGISSALLFIKVWQFYRRSINEMIKSHKNIEERVFKKIKCVNKELEQADSLISIILGAISLHNIDKEIWVMADTVSNNLDLQSFKINLTSNESHKALPIAFLLRFCDELQSWDRHRFRAPRKADDNIENKDLNITVDKNYIYVYFRSDYEVFKNPAEAENSEYSKLKKKLETYLEENVIDKLLRFGNKKKVSEPIKNDHSSDGENVSEVIDNIKLKWLVGAVNFDEDVHFSSYYLEQSMIRNSLPQYKEIGYKNIISIYQDFNETYYIPESECSEVALKLIEKTKRNYYFWDDIFENINDLIKELDEVFDFEVNSAPFINMSNDELFSYYIKHNKVHTNLYQYARIPEVLDRGNSTFTHYLMDYLKKKSKDLSNDESKLMEIFEILTYPENISYNGREIIELYGLISEIKEDYGEMQKFIKSSNPTDNQRLQIKLNSKTISNINSYAHDWAYWGYHGYGNRAIRDFSYFLERVKIELNDTELCDLQSKLLYTIESNNRKRMLTFSELEIDDVHQFLFKLYSRIGTIKIKRRYFQLKNFYFLDQLIAEMAKRFNTSEAIVRCLLPNEVESLLEGDVALLEIGDLRSKADCFAYVLDEKGSKIIVGEESKCLQNKLRLETETIVFNSGIINGITASMGQGNYSGVCRVINRYDKNLNFNKGDILVSSDTDPDLFDILRIAGAVLTETGGLTCHAAIVCRELKIPCIIGIKGLLNKVKDGDYVEVEPEKERISIKTNISTNIVKSLNIRNEDYNCNIGNKAKALLEVKKLGLLVPEFFCVPYKLIKNLVKEKGNEEKASELQSIYIELDEALNEINAPLYAIRSSTTSEDKKDFSGAGQEITELLVSKKDVIRTLIYIANSYSLEDADGSIIVQRMILGNVSGILFTKNPINQKNEILIEAVPGGNEHLTSGKIIPVRYFLDPVSEHIKEVNDNKTWKGLLKPEKLLQLRRISKIITNHFNAPQDIEWTISDGKIYILQSRAITGEEKVDSMSIVSKHTGLLPNIMSIYRAYMIPLDLQDHMLRAASIAAWILDHWKGEILNRNDILETLLIHDMGNLVKSSNDNFRRGFPDKYYLESLDYWDNIKKWLIDRFGKNDVEVTYNIAKEINVSEKVLKMLGKKQFVNNEETYKSDDYEIKICAYSDQRVSPTGIMPLNERLREAVIRYKGVKGASVNVANRDELIEDINKVEEQIFNFVDGKPEDINDSSTASYMEDLKDYIFR